MRRPFRRSYRRAWPPAPSPRGWPAGRSGFRTILRRQRRSTGEARRQIKGGGLRVNDAPVTDERGIIGAREFEGDGVVKLSLGKKKHVLLERA